MNAFSLIMLGVAGVSFLAVRWLRDAAARIAFVDLPNQRSLHATATPRIGGVGILVSFAIGLIALAIWRGDHPLSRSDISIVAWEVVCMFWMAVVSLCDDRWNLPAWVRLPIHLLVAGAFVIGSGSVVRSIPIPFAGSIALGPAAVPLTVLFISWVANLYNFMDGMDGVAAMMAICGFGFLAYFAVVRGNAVIAGLSFLIIPSVAGFLAHNFPPASVFMGDAGSVPLGFLAGSLSVAAVSRGVVDLWVPVLIFSPFIVDASVTLARRAAQGKRFWQAHREHYYQRLVLAGWSHKSTLAAETIVMVLSGATAILYSRTASAGQAAILAGATLIYVMLGLAVARVERTARQRRSAV